MGCGNDKALSQMGVIQFIASDTDPVGFKQIHGFVNGNFDVYAKGRATIARASHKKPGMIDVVLPGDVVFFTMEHLSGMAEMFNRALDELEQGGDINNFVAENTEYNRGKFLVSYAIIKKAFNLFPSNLNKNGPSKRTN